MCRIFQDYGVVFQGVETKFYYWANFSFTIGRVNVTKFALIYFLKLKNIEKILEKCNISWKILFLAQDGGESKNLYKYCGSNRLGGVGGVTAKAREILFSRKDCRIFLSFYHTNNSL